MNFFEAQDQAKRASRRLILLFMLATLTIVAGVSVIALLVAMGDASMNYYPGSNEQLYGSAIEQHLSLVLTVASLTLVVIVGASVMKILDLAATGGGGIAEAMGGKRVNSLDASTAEVRLHNIVEEMSIASGTAMPEVYVLDGESGINAFAAGFSPDNAAVAVTRGALEKLNRDELQGVIAHEFSHILNGDMRLNIRLMGVLYGILVIGLGGRLAMRLARHADSARAVAGLFFVGFMLLVLGYSGLFFGRMIKAGVSRQREYLADASAVQFTRQTQGLAGALWKIGQNAHQSYIDEPKAEEVSHMLFANGTLGIARLFATHPPLGERIHALDPSFDMSSESLETGYAPPGDGAVSGFAAAATDITAPISDQVGQITTQAIAFAATLRQTIPDNVYDATQRPEPAYLLALATLLSSDDKHRNEQLAILLGMLGARRTQQLKGFYVQLDMLGPRYRIPLLELAGPALRRLEPETQEFVEELLQRVIEADNEIDLHEYCIAKVVRLQMQALAKHKRSKHLGRHRRSEAEVRLLGAIAAYGHATKDGRQAAFAAAMQRLNLPADGQRYDVVDAKSLAELDASVDALRDIGFEDKSRLIDAIGAAVLQDGDVSLEEYELIRVICMTLQCPLPPFLDELPPTV